MRQHRILSTLRRLKVRDMIYVVLSSHPRAPSPAHDAERPGEHRGAVAAIPSDRLYWMIESSESTSFRDAARMEMRWRSNHYAHFV